MNNRHTLSVLVASLVLCGAASSAQASIFVPAGLLPGDTYHLAFVTSGTRDALSTDIADYNAFVQAQAALNPALTGTDMGVTWSVIGSTAAVDARDNALVSAPVYLLDGTLIASGFADIWDGSLISELDTDQFAAGGISDIVHTGSNPDGTTDSTFPLGMGNLAANVEGGFSSVASGAWIDFGSSIDDEPRRFYALSALQTVPATADVPEAASLVVWLGLASVVGLVGVNRRRGALQNS